MPDNKLILPDDPLWGQPVIMNDPYKNAVTPKMAQEQRMRELDAEREKEAKTIKGDMIKYANSAVAHAPDAWMKSAQAVGVSNIMTNPMWFSPIQTPQNWQTASKRREVYQWARFFYESEPKVAAAIDFYSRFPMNSFKLEARSPSVGSEKIMKWFKHNIVDRLDLDEQLKMISSEYFLLGDVFILREIQCPVCGGSAVDPDTGEQCNHPGGTFKRLQVLNPDWVEVRQSSITDESDIVFIPDEELQRIVFYKQPKAIYDRIPDKIKQLILSRKPIPLSSRIVTHLKHMPVPYGTYGTSLVRRLFTTLAYKTKLMTANWIVAERLILPVRVVKVGSDERPATSADIADIQQQLAATSNDPNLTIVTHNNFEYDYYGASGKILQVTQEMEYIGKEILDGFMLNQSLLNGEMSGYQSAQVGVETLIRRIESWRNTLAKFVEEDIFKPVAEMQGFIDKKASEELGVPVYIYPKIKWNDLNLKDKSQWHQILVQLHDKQVISTQTLCEELGLNYDKEIERLRYEQARGGPMGGGLGQGGGGMGGMGGGGMGGAPMPGMDGGMGGAPMPGMDGGMGMGGAGGGMGMGGGAPMPGGGGAPAMASSGKITKKGKSKEKELSQEEIAAMTPMIKLTSIEQKMAQMLERIASNLGWTPELTSNKIRMQFPVENPTGHKPYMLDFALPEYKLGLEAEGSFWHTQPNQAEDDNKRDALLAQRGWTIIRFDDSVIEDAPQDVESTMYQYITKAIKGREEKKEGQSSFYTIYKNSMTDVYQNWPMHLGALLEEDTKC